jgi:hypothetical protein
MIILNKEVSLSPLEINIFFWNLNTKATQIEITGSQVARLV